MKNDKLKTQYRINEQIRVREVRIVGDEGSSVMSTRDALNQARDMGVDLVEISPNANPPVCRLIEFPLPQPLPAWPSFPSGVSSAGRGIWSSRCALLSLLC